MRNSSPHVLRIVTTMAVLAVIHLQEMAVIAFSLNGERTSLTDAISVSNKLVYLQVGQTQRIPCKHDKIDVISASWFKHGESQKETPTADWETIIRFAEPHSGGNYTAEAYIGRVSLTPHFDMALGRVTQEDAGLYLCQIIPLVETSIADYKYKVNVTILDDKFPERPPEISMKTLLKPDENEVLCPVATSYIKNPTVYWSRQSGEASTTDILVARFSDGSVLSKDSTFDMERVAGFPLVTTGSDPSKLAGLLWCHVSSELDGVQLKSALNNVTFLQPSSSLDLPVIIISTLVPTVAVVILCTAVWRKKNTQELDNSEENSPINLDPINSDTCTAWKLQSKFDNLKLGPIRLAKATSTGKIVLLDDSGVHVMQVRTGSVKTISKKWTSQAQEYVAMATLKSCPREILLAKGDGTIAKMNIKTGSEETIVESEMPSPRKLIDIATDDDGDIYAAGSEDKNVYIYTKDGCFKSKLKVCNLSDLISFISAYGSGKYFVAARSGTGGAERFIIKKYKGENREDFDIHLPPDEICSVTRLYVNRFTGRPAGQQSSLFVVNSRKNSDTVTSDILEFSAEDGQYKRNIIENWPGYVGMMFISEDKLAFFDSKQVTVYQWTPKTKKTKQQQQH